MKCLKSFDGLHAAMGAQKAREGIFGHQTVDPLLGFVESVCARSVRDTQQSLAGLSVQVHLQRDNRSKPALRLYLLEVYSFLHRPPAGRQGWWTGCRCCRPWSSAGSKRKPGSPRRPARTQGSPRWTQNAGSLETPGDQLRAQTRARLREDVNTAAVMGERSFKWF